MLISTESLPLNTGLAKLISLCLRNITGKGKALCGRAVCVCYSASAKLYGWACGSGEQGAPCSFLFNFVRPLEVQLACCTTRSIEVKEIILLKSFLYFQWFFSVCLFVLFFLLLCSMRGVSSIQGLSGHFCPLNSLFWMGVRALTVHTIPSALCVINCSFWGLCSFSCQWQHWCVLRGMTTCSLRTRAVLPKTSSCLGLWGSGEQFCRADGSRVRGEWGEQAGGSGSAAVTHSSCGPCSTFLPFSLPVEFYLGNCFCGFLFVSLLSVPAVSLMPKTSQGFISSICTMTGAQATYLLSC